MNYPTQTSKLSLLPLLAPSANLSALSASPFRVLNILKKTSAATGTWSPLSAILVRYCRSASSVSRIASATGRWRRPSLMRLMACWKRALVSMRFLTAVVDSWPLRKWRPGLWKVVMGV